MRTERAIKFKLLQLNNILPFRSGFDKQIVEREIKLLEWILNMDKRSLYLQKLKIKQLKIKTKQEYIADKLRRSKKLNNSKLPYGLQWLNLYAEVEKAAEKSYNKYQKQIK